MAETRKTTRTSRAPKAKPVDEYGHLQPQAPELEEAVLGALMIEKDAYSLVSEILRPESFYERRHQLIYSAITSLALRQQPVDILTVAEQLRSTGELERSIGLSPVKLDRNGNYNIKIGFSEPRSDGGSNAKLANIIEYGKHGQPAKPFLKPAKSTTKSACIEKMKQSSRRRSINYEYSRRYSKRGRAFGHSH